MTTFYLYPMSQALFFKVEIYRVSGKGFWFDFLFDGSHYNISVWVKCYPFNNKYMQNHYFIGISKEQFTNYLFFPLISFSSLPLRFKLRNLQRMMVGTLSSYGSQHSSVTRSDNPVTWNKVLFLVFHLLLLFRYTLYYYYQ